MERETDRWLRRAAVLGPVITFILGLCSGSVIAYQAYKNDNARIQLMEGWKDRQEDFNKEVIKAIATLQQIVKQTR